MTLTLRSLEADIGNLRHRVLDLENKKPVDTLSTIDLLNTAVTRLTSYVQDMNERISALEAFANRSIASKLSDKAPNDKVLFEWPEIDELSDELSDEDVAKLLQEQRDKLAQAATQTGMPLMHNGEIKTMGNTDGSTSFRLQMPGKRWLAIKKDVNDEVIECFVEDENSGERKIIEKSEYESALGGLVDILRLAPFGDDPNPNIDDRAMNTDV